MATTNTTSTTGNAHLEFIGMIVEIAGVASVVAGVVLSLHHWPAAVALIGGGVAYFIGKKLRAS
jgi:F0F1-type ATP synthase assembly protein I